MLKNTAPTQAFQTRITLDLAAGFRALTSVRRLSTNKGLAAAVRAYVDSATPIEREACRLCTAAHDAARQLLDTDA